MLLFGGSLMIAIYNHSTVTCTIKVLRSQINDRKLCFCLEHHLRL